MLQATTAVTIHKYKCMQGIGTGCCPTRCERLPSHCPSGHGRQPSHGGTGKCGIPIALGFFTGVEPMEDCIVVNGRPPATFNSDIATDATPRACHNPRTGSATDRARDHKDRLGTTGACRCFRHSCCPAIELVTGTMPCCFRPVQPPLRHVAGMGRHGQAR